MNSTSSNLRIRLILALGFLLVAGGCLRLWQKPPIDGGPAGPPVAREPFSRTWSDREVLLVGLGDSVTDGFCARSGYSYFDRLIANPGDEFADLRGLCLSAVLPRLKSKNLAVSGSTSIEHVERQLPQLPVAGSNVIGLIVITTGGNDLIHNYGRTPPRDQAMYGASWEQAKPWIANFERRLDQMISGIHNRFPGGCHIFLANIYDPTDGHGDIENAGVGLPPWPDGMKILEAYNDVIRRCAEKHPSVHRVDFHGAFLGHGIHCAPSWTEHHDAGDPRYWYCENLEDPNERGYDVIRRLFLNEIARIAGALR